MYFETQLRALLMIAVIYVKPTNVDGHADPEVYLDVPGIIQHWGYPCESVQVTTNDGYKLTMHHIPHGKYQRAHNGKTKPVIFLQHGLEGSSSNWITNLPWEAAGFMFADAGFDVWMGNFRGNTYSRAHKWLTPDKLLFWQFSYDQMAKYDLPKMIDYVLKATRQQQLYYVGHSMGTMTVFAQGSQHAEFASKIKVLFALAPVARVGHVQGALKYIAPHVIEIEALLMLFGGWGQFLPSSTLQRWMAMYFCNHPIVQQLCENMMFLLSGVDSKQMNASRVPVYIAHSPAGTSIHCMTISDELQNVNENKFLMYDYGSPRMNEAHYGQPFPPRYDLTKFRIPTYIFRGDMDTSADPQDVDWLQSQLTTIRHVFRYKEFNHLDFIWGLNAAAEVYEKIIRIVRADAMHYG